MAGRSSDAARVRRDFLITGAARYSSTSRCRNKVSWITTADANTPISTSVLVRTSSALVTRFYLMQEERWRQQCWHTAVIKQCPPAVLVVNTTICTLHSVPVYQLAILIVHLVRHLVLWPEVDGKVTIHQRLMEVTFVPCFICLRAQSGERDGDRAVGQGRILFVVFGCNAAPRH